VPGPGFGCWPLWTLENAPGLDARLVAVAATNATKVRNAIDHPILRRCSISPSLLEG
jgi:hypothetical protein